MDECWRNKGCILWLLRCLFFWVFTTPTTPFAPGTFALRLHLRWWQRNGYLMPAIGVRFSEKRNNGSKDYKDNSLTTTP